MATHNGVNPHTAADLLRQAMAQNSARYEPRDHRDDSHDHVGTGSNSPTPSGVETPQPDLSDKRLPGIHSYFGQVGKSHSPSSPLHSMRSVISPGVEIGVDTLPEKHVREKSCSRASSISSGSMVMIERGQGHPSTTPPPQPDDPAGSSVHTKPGVDNSRYPPTPVSSAASFLQKDSEAAESGKPMVESGIASVTQALRNFVLPKSSSSVRAKRHQSLPVSSVARISVPAAQLSNPTSSAQSPTTAQSPFVTPKPSEKPKNSKSFKELSKLTSDVAPGSRKKTTPPHTPRASSQDGAHQRSPLSSTSTTASAPADRGSQTTQRSPPHRKEDLPTNTPRGRLAVTIAEGRNLKPSYDPYVVAQFEYNEYISRGPKHDAMDVDPGGRKVPADALSAEPIRRTDSDMGRSMAIPMRSRQSSSNGMNETDVRTLLKVNDPQWDHEAVFDVLGHQSEIDISVYDRHQDTFLGHVRLCLNLSEQQPLLEGFFPLEPRGPQDNLVTGDIHIKMQFSKTDKKHFGPDDFQILKLIGKGTFGQVFQVRKKDTQRIYAMKVLSKKVIIQKKEVAHTLGERNILVRTAMADSPFIVGLKFSFQTLADLYLVTDFMSGGELFWHLQKEGRFKEDRAKFYIAELILALQHLHEHDIVYRDLKPENILLDANGHIALCDFGLSKADLARDQTTSTFCGTTEYLAPEVLLDEQGYTKMVDFWSLGVLVFEMCCGWSPFYAEDTQQMYKNIAFGKVRFPRDALSTEGRNFVKGLLNRNPKHRLGATHDAQELIEHPFFNDIDWVALGRKNLVPPFKPKLTSIADTSNFDPEFTNALNTSSSLNARAAALAAGNAPASTPLSPTMQNAFRGFTFVDESMLDSAYAASRPGQYDGQDDDDSVSRPTTQDHRMSGVQRTGEDGIFSEENWDM